ncbi:alcohol dehydrogenase catalytic domain-containing protein [Cryptosporangium sp. NPDC051539]|uniref:alcohol dehydrogenase catalytic domain-containing protein n=1 Tax=Cryptosporangium sp. NPDC051539 TaxID=3363962 RepID=UPI00378B4785
MARRGDPGYAPRWPFVPGLEVSGTVVEHGPEVTQLRVGDRVVALTNEGGLAEIALAKAALTVPVPAGSLFGNSSGAPLAALPATALLYARNASIGGFSLAALSAQAPEKVASSLRVALNLLADGRASTEATVLNGLAAAIDAQQALATGTWQIRRQRLRGRHRFLGRDPGRSALGNVRAPW